MFPPFRPTVLNESGNTAVSDIEIDKKAGGLDSVEPVEELDFTQDPPLALLILLRITHFRFNDMPSNIHAELLSDLALLCDQYDCVPLVKPWLSQWLGDEEILLQGYRRFTVSGRRLRDRWLFISWVFGRERVFEGVSLSVLKDLETTGDGGCELLDGLYGPMPPGLIGMFLSLEIDKPTGSV